MIIINNILVGLDTDFSMLQEIAAKHLKISKDKILSVKLNKKSVDARKKSDIKFCISLIVVVAENEAKLVKRIKNASIYNEPKYVYPVCKQKENRRPVIVGFGPAGMFCSLYLARCGLKPIVIERGGSVEQRQIDVENFFSGKPLNCESNVQFGEGGAGTFSDGKLNTGIKDIRCGLVLKDFALYGANENILYESKAHIGTDVLIDVVKNIRNEIISLGGEIRFNTRLETIELENKSVTEIILSNGEKIKSDALVLAIGHSARDTFKMLNDKGILMQRKPFSVGVRIEHLQSDINKALYGEYYNHKALSAADYKMSVHLNNGRGVYTFCMCPGGQVINASSENGAVAVNGMSYSRRDGKNANSALLVGIQPEDLEGDSVLAGIEFQREIEQKAYNLSDGTVPITTVGAFLNGEKACISEVLPTVLPRVKESDFTKIFPSFVISSIKDGIIEFAKKLQGFDNPSAILTAPETRSSCPVRIVRNQKGVSQNTVGLFPCGEGAGYAGGIMSAAVDGIKTAEAIIEWYNNE